MQIKPDVVDLRVQRRIAELDHYRFTYRERTDGWSVSRDWPKNIARPEAVTGLLEMNDVDADETTGSFDMPFSAPGKVTQTYWLSARIDVPSELADSPVYLRMPTNSESMVYLNNEAWQGLDVNRKLVRLNPHGKADASYQIDIMLFSARDRDGKSLDAELVCLDEDVWGLQHDLRAAVGIARSLPKEDATAIGYWQALVNVINAIDFHSAVGSAGVTEARRMLAQQIEHMRATGHAPKPVSSYMVGNSHIDVTWLWTLDETRQKMGRTTATALRYIDEHPSYRFAQSQAQIYDYLREDFPELFSKVQERVADGRWEAIGAAWIEPDCNVTGGESLVRQILYGQKFWREHFGQESKTFWLPDTFGYAWALPQILVKSGLDTFMTQKLTWSETNKFPHGHFEWEGVDGSRIRCTFPQTYVSRTFPDEMANYYKGFPSKDAVSSFFYLYGYGDGGGGPVREDIEIGDRLGNKPGFMQCQFSTAEDALQAVRDDADRTSADSGQAIPVWRGELYLEYHRGTLASHARVKRSNRLCELQLRLAEVLAVQAEIATNAAYPADELEVAWKKVLLNQFHDILPGTSIPEVYPTVHRMYDEVFETTKHSIAASIDVLTSAAEKSITVMNSLSWPVVDWAEVDLDNNGEFHLKDANGKTIAHQILSESGGKVRIGFEASVAGLSNSIYQVSDGDAAFSATIKCTDSSIENTRFLVEFDDNGHIQSVFDKAHDREWLDGPGNQLQTFDDRPNNWEAWDLNEWYAEQPLDLLSLQSAEIVETGPVRAVMRLKHVSSNGSTVEQDVAIYAQVPRIDFLTKVDWQEERVLLKAAFPVAVHSASASYDIQFGTIERPTHQNTSWDEARFEVCGHKWTDLSEGNGGVSLLNDCKYGHDIRDNMMRITLLRNPTHPDARCPTPSYLFPDQESEVVFCDTGEHEMRYSLYPHTGDWRNGTVTEAYAFNAPLQAVVNRKGGEQLGVESTFGLVLESLKKAEDGNGYIARVFEAHGGRQTSELKFARNIESVEAVDLMERPSATEGAVEIVDGSTVRFYTKPFEIRTFRLKF